jgi:hypothetical protein
MLLNPNWQGQGARLAQVGWLERDYDERHTFIEWQEANGADHLDMNFAPQPVDIYTNYSVLYLFNGWNFTFQVNGATIANAPAGWVPTMGEIYGEIKTAASQMPGGYNKVEVFDQSKLYYSGSWRDFDGIGTKTDVDGVWHRQQKVSPRLFVIWDTACST